MRYFLGKICFFLGGGGGDAGALKGRVISKIEHQKGRVIPLCMLFKGRVTHLLQNFLMWIFGMLLSIFRTD